MTSNSREKKKIQTGGRDALESGRRGEVDRDSVSQLQ